MAYFTLHFVYTFLHFYTKTMTRTEKQRILQAQRLDLIKRHPTFSESDIRCFNFITRSDTKANDLTWLITHYLQWVGHQAERINTQGQARVRKIVDGQTGQQIGNRTNGVTYTPTTGTRGSADISSTIAVTIGGRKIGLSVKWEVKIGKDSQSRYQKLYEAAIGQAAGYYFIVTCIGDFFHYYDALLAEFHEPSEQAEKNI